jgi:hypothetical protein
LRLLAVEALLQGVESLVLGIRRAAEAGLAMADWCVGNAASAVAGDLGAAGVGRSEPAVRGALIVDRAQRGSAAVPRVAPMMTIKIAKTIRI